MYEVIVTNSFARYYKICIKRRYDIILLNNLMEILAESGTVPQKNIPHILSGILNGCWECHIKSDWLLIWIKDEKLKTITLIGTGTHSDLF
jgi:mRNA interferase YafQ